MSEDLIGPEEWLMRRKGEMGDSKQGRQGMLKNVLEEIRLVRMEVRKMTQSLCQGGEGG